MKCIKEIDMKANELRIGNFIYNGLSKIITVTNIDSDGVNGFHDESVGGINYEYGGRIESIYRITLTEEWLLKFGFETDNIEWWNGIISIGIYKDGLFYCPTGEISLRIGKEIQYVHQLQNLYFALTGEELTINN